MTEIDNVVKYRADKKWSANETYVHNAEKQINLIGQTLANFKYLLMFYLYYLD